MILRFSILWLLLQFSIGAFAQETDFNVKGIVMDVETGLPLDQVNISVLDKENKGTTSDSLGRFSIKLSTFPLILKFTYIGYEEELVEINSNKTKTLKIRLKPILVPLPEIFVSSERKIDTVYRAPLNVVDYAFKGDYLILLIYKNVFEKYQLVSLDPDEKIVTTFSLKDHRPSNLFSGCTGNVYLNTDIGAYSISIDSSSIALSKLLDPEYYKNIVQPCVLATDSFLYFNTYYYQGQAQRYFGYSKNNELEKVSFPLIQNLRNIDLLIEETGTGFPRSGDVWQKNVSYRLASLRNAQYGLKGMMKIFYPKLFSPMVKKDSLVCIFNHLESAIQYFEIDGTFISSVPIQYHKLKKWNKTLIYDKKTETAYTTFDTQWGNQICAINMDSGALGDAIPISRDFIENLKIHDGNLYFLYRNPYHRSRHQMLQKIRLD